MKILFINAGCLPFHHRTLDKSPLGGTETAVIRLAGALHDRGHEVIVAVAHPNPPLSQPLYVPLAAIADVGAVDVVVAVRDWRSLFSGVSAKKQFLWVPDTMDQPVTLGLADARVMQRCDSVLAVSDWHRGHINAAAGISKHKIVVLKNGVDLALFSDVDERISNRLIYSSTPFRGLRYLPSVMRELARRGVEVQLHVFSGYAVYGGNANRPASELAALASIEAELRSLANVTMHGNVTQAQLAREFQRSSILVYPNNFLETSCITVMEAGAAGCVAVTSSYGALPETVGAGGVLVDGTPERAGYLEEFTHAVARLVADRTEWNRLSQAALNQARSNSWVLRASEFEALV